VFTACDTTTAMNFGLSCARRGSWGKKRGCQNGTLHRLRAAQSSARARFCAIAAIACVALTVAGESNAAVIWSSGFESNDLNDWDYQLNPEGLSIVTEPVAAGQYALRAELTRDRVWDNGIFRTELQYASTKSKASEGAETYFGWSVYLPAPLPMGDYQLGYFETRSTYNQVFSLHAQGSDLSLELNHGATQRKHPVPGVLTTGAWHRIVYHVKWSADPAVGFVSLWWDGSKVVDQAHARTFVDDDPALIQLGLLKDPPEPPQPVVLFVDEAIYGESYADVSLGIPELVAPAPSETAPAGTAPAGTTLTTGASGPESAATTGVSSVPPTTTAPPSGGNDEGGCSVNAARNNDAALTWGPWGVLALLAAARRRRIARDE
jgi:MYXO-CTERM domain-containing protein